MFVVQFSCTETAVALAVTTVGSAAATVDLECPSSSVAQSVRQGSRPRRDTDTLVAPAAANVEVTIAGVFEKPVLNQIFTVAVLLNRSSVII